MADLLKLYNDSKSDTLSVVKAMGTKDGNAGVNFMDGQARGPWNSKFTSTPDVWQDGLVENKEGSKPNPAATNNGSYPLSRWTEDALKIGFEQAGPPQLGNKGYWGNTRFTVFKDSAGRTTGDGTLHKYAPLSGKQYAGGTKDKGVDLWADTRVKASPTSTSVRGLNG